MNFVPKEFYMPLYMLSRNRLKDEHSDNKSPEVLRKHISKKGAAYSRKCKEENTKETVDKKRCQHIAGLEANTKKQCPSPRPKILSPDLTKHKTWQIAPNRYNVPNKPFESKQGAGGALWAKVHKTKSLKETPKEMGGKMYDINCGPESSCLKYTGKFQTDPRSRKATNRSMISNHLTCYHNPSEPGPANYYPQLHEIQYKISPVDEPKRPNPHIFLRHLSIPSKRLSLHRKDTANEPGPGRYENRYGPGCRGLSKLVYEPGIDLIILKEQRLKFRQLPYKKINSDLYCSPAWIHVEGNGFRRLFGEKPPKLNKKSEPSQEKDEKAKKVVYLYPDAQYMRLVNFPQRVQISKWVEPIEEKEVTIRYNCTAKRIRRRQLKESKKIAFGSGQARWKDDDRPLPITEEQLKKIKERLPTERQLHDHPVMRVPPKMIQSKLLETPKHMQPVKPLEVRKRSFKFDPIPEPKLFVTKEDLRPPSIDYTSGQKRLYRKPLNLLNYLKDSVIESKKYEGQIFNQQI